MGWNVEELHFRSVGWLHWCCSKECQGKVSQEKLRGGVWIRRTIHAEGTACAKGGKGLASSGNRREVRTAEISRRAMRGELGQ